MIGTIEAIATSPICKKIYDMMQKPHNSHPIEILRDEFLARLCISQNQLDMAMKAEKWTEPLLNDSALLSYMKGCKWVTYMLPIKYNEIGLCFR